MPDINIPDNNITPAITVSPLKYWVQKVLPTIYDDSLSNVELLGKVVDYLNNVITATNQNTDNVNAIDAYVNDVKDQLVEAYNELQSYVNTYLDNLDIQSEVNDKLDEMAADGTLDTLLAPIVDGSLTILVPDIVDDWLEENITNPSNPPLDASLSEEHAAAQSLATGNAIAAVNAKIDGVSEQTENLWLNGDIYVTTVGWRHIVLKQPLSAGTYKFSAIVESDNELSNTCYIGFSTSTTTSIAQDTIIAYANVESDGNRHYYTITLTDTVSSARLRSGPNSGSGSSGYDATWKNIQIITGTDETPYEPPFTAIDSVARESITGLNTSISAVDAKTTELESDLINYYLQKYKDNNIFANTSASNRGVTFAWNATNRNYDITGSVESGQTFAYRLTTARSAHLSRQTMQGCTVVCKSTDPTNLYVQCYFVNSSNTVVGSIYTVRKIQTFYPPANTDCMVIRIRAEAGKTFNDSISYQIVSDTSTPIYSTNNAYDMTAAIKARLDITGYCKLGVGIFKIKNLVMPDYACIEGSGRRSMVTLASDGEYSLKLGRFNVLRNFYLSGTQDGTDITLNSSTVGAKHGIYIKGNYSSTADATVQPCCAIISDMYIAHFTGGGITCDDTGSYAGNGIVVNNCNIRNCGAGVNIAYSSEFHKFDNIYAQENYYGCVNNGGNNNISNSDFSKCIVGYINKMVDGSGRSMPNTGHGRLTNCVIQHNDYDTTTLGKGLAIWIEGNENGMIIANTNIGYSKILIKNSRAVQFIGCQIARIRTNATTYAGVPITISQTDGNTRYHFFQNCVFNRQPQIVYDNESGDGHITWSDCYTWGNEVVTNT